MNTLANIFHLGIKELRSLWRDPVLLIFVVFTFPAAIYSSASSAPETLNNAPIAIVDEDRSPLTRSIIDAFYPPYFTPPALIDRAEMDARMDAGIDTFALDIPSGFQEDLLAGKSPTIQLNVDATRMTQAFSGSGYVQNIVHNEVSRYLQRHASQGAGQVELVLRARFNPALDPSWFAAVTQVVSLISLLAMVLTGAALIREREHGTIEHLLVMPVTAFEIMTAKIWSMGLVVLGVVTFSLVFVIQGLLQIPILGSVPLFLAGAALEIFAVTSMGIFLATMAGSMPQFGMLMILVMLPLQVLSGAMTPRESMPDFVRHLMLAAPDTHFNIMAQAVLFRGAGLEVVWPQLLALTAIGGILFVFALRRFRAFLK